MTESILQIFYASMGTLGFALFFSVRSRHLLMATLGGTLSWSCYLVVMALDGRVFISALIAAIAICFWSELMARLRKAPANVFLMPGIVPLLPGGSLYYTMNALVQGDVEEFTNRGLETALIALGIAVGIVIATEIVRLMMSISRRRRKAKQKRRERKQSESI